VEKLEGEIQQILLLQIQLLQIFIYLKEEKHFQIINFYLQHNDGINLKLEVALEEKESTRRRKRG